MKGKDYPWGDSIDGGKANYNLNVGDPTAVGSYAPSGYDLYDMAGNVWEWCLDEYDSNYYKQRLKDNPIAGGPISDVISNFTNVTTQRVVRGGSWSGIALNLRVANRNYYGPTDTDYVVGFRCAGSVTP